MDRPDQWSEDVLLAYAQGRATPEQSARIKAAADSDPHLAAELAVMAGLRSALRDTTDAPDARAFGWKRLEREIGQSAPAPQAPTVTRGSAWRVAAVLLGAVVLAQAAYMGFVPRTGDAARYETVTEQGDGAVLGLSFAPQTTAEEMAELLRATGGQIIEGPSALGLYRVRFDSDRAREAALVVLDGSDLVDLVAVE